MDLRHEVIRSADLRGWRMPEGEEQRRAARRPSVDTAANPGGSVRRHPGSANGATSGANGDGSLRYVDQPSGWSAAPQVGPVVPPVPPAPPRGGTVSIGDFFSLLRRRIITFLVGVVLCLVAAYVMFQTATKQYEAKSAVKVAPVTAAGDTDAAKDISTITESRIVTSTAVARQAAKILAFSGSSDSLLAHVAVNSPLNSQLIYITYTSTSPRRAADGANAFAAAYLAYRKSVGQSNLTDEAKLLTSRITALASQLRALPANAPSAQRTALQQQIGNLNSRLAAVSTTVVVPGQVVGVAQSPSAPSSPKQMLYIAGGLLLGLIVGIVGAVIRERRDDEVHGISDLERSLGVPVLATVPTRARPNDVPAAAAGTLSVATSPDELDAYRTLATKLRAPAAGNEASSFLLVRGGGAKEEHAPLNLAAMLARQGVQTALVTTDRGLRHAAPLFDDEKLPTSLDEGLTPVPALPNLWLLSLGPEDEVDSTISVQGALIEDMLNLVDVALIDGVNVDLASSSLALSQLTGSAVVLAVNRRTTHSELAASIRELAQVGTRPLGGVLYVRRGGFAGRSRKSR